MHRFVIKSHRTGNFLTWSWMEKDGGLAAGDKVKQSYFQLWFSQEQWHEQTKIIRIYDFICVYVVYKPVLRDFLIVDFRWQSTFKYPYVFSKFLPGMCFEKKPKKRLSRRGWHHYIQKR